jgi:hypothetical protein
METYAAHSDRQVPLLYRAKTLGYYRYEVPGGEFVLEHHRGWRIAFNGVQIGGLFSEVAEALAAVARRRECKLPGPDLTGVPNPASDLTLWHARPASR